MKHVVICLVGAGMVLAALVALWVRMSGDDSRESPVDEGQTHHLIKDAGRRRNGGGLAKGEIADGVLGKKRGWKHAGRRSKPKRRRADVLAHLSRTDRRLYEQVQSALDRDDLTNTVLAAQDALTSTNAEVRLHAVDALGWFGSDALVELTPLMADPNEEVAEAAIGHVETALQGMEDQSESFALSTIYLETFSVNEDAMTMLSGVMSSAANQIAEPDDPDSPSDVAKARDNRETVVDSLAVMIGKGGLLEEAAREVYNDVSGEEWISEAEAVRWAKDPENYEAPEPVEDGQSEVFEETDSQGL